MRRCRHAPTAPRTKTWNRVYGIEKKVWIWGVWFRVQGEGRRVWGVRCIPHAEAQRARLKNLASPRNGSLTTDGFRSLTSLLHPDASSATRRKTRIITPRCVPTRVRPKPYPGERQRVVIAQLFAVALHEAVPVVREDRKSRIAVFLQVSLRARVQRGEDHHGRPGGVGRGGEGTVEGWDAFLRIWGWNFWVWGVGCGGWGVECVA